MARVLPMMATAGWVGYHGAWALGLVAAATGRSGAPLPGGMTLPDVAGWPAALVLVLAATHAAVAVTFLRTFGSGCFAEVEKGTLVALAGGLVLAVAGSLLGIASDLPGAYAASVALTLAALMFARMAGAEDEGEVDHAAFMREAARLGAQVARERERPSARRRNER